MTINLDTIRPSTSILLKAMCHLVAKNFRFFKSAGLLPLSSANLTISAAKPYDIMPDVHVANGNTPNKHSTSMTVYKHPTKNLRVEVDFSMPILTTGDCFPAALSPSI